jgi:hypothetical protein
MLNSIERTVMPFNDFTCFKNDCAVYDYVVVIFSIFMGKLQVFRYKEQKPFL